MPRGRRFVFPLLIITVGVIALFYNLGVLDAQRLAQLVSLWPLLLILIGLELILSRTLPRRVLPLVSLALTAVLLIAALAYVTASPGTTGPGAQQSNSSERIEGLTSGELALEFGAWSVDLAGGALGDDLYRAHFEFRAGERPPQVRVDRPSGIVHIQQSRDRVLVWPFDVAPPGRDRAEVSLSDRVPWRLRIQGGAIRSTMNLSTLQLTGLDMSGGATRTDIRLPRPKGSVAIDISGGAANVNLTVPAGSAAKIRVTGGASRLQVDGSAFRSIGENAWESPSFGQATDRFDIRISGGASRVQLTTS